ncbi:tellurite resistance/C4-dicarboxylate transporter family protein [Streptomyces tanashiensis]
MALVLFLLGLVLYADALARFDVRQVVTGAGDHWIAGGAMAISALAGSKLLTSGAWSGGRRRPCGGRRSSCSPSDLTWYSVLLCGEFAHRRLRYDVLRWATVFPLGMTAVASLSTAAATGVGLAGRRWAGSCCGSRSPPGFLTAYGLIRTFTGRPAEHRPPAR